MLENKSLFSNETLDSIAMAETYGGATEDSNNKCGESKCALICDVKVYKCSGMEEEMASISGTAMLRDATMQEPVTLVR